MTARRKATFSEDPMVLAGQVGELARDVSREFANRVPVREVTVETVWEVPFLLYVGDVKPLGVIPVAAEDLDDATNTPGPYGMHWAWEDGYVVVKTIAGINTFVNYRLTFAVLGGE